MIGKPQKLEPKLYYDNFSLSSRIPEDYPLRKIKKLVDFGFVRPLVRDLYGERGNTSIDPVVILKLIFLLFYENVSSERELIRQLPMRMDWLWFCNFDLDTAIPNHSVLSKARKRWGKEVFNKFFINILEQCIDADLVDGTVVHVDSSIIKADANKHNLHANLTLVAEQFGERLEYEPEFNSDNITTKISSTDPDARVTRKNGERTLGFKDHRVVDDKKGIITSTTTTAANINDAKVLPHSLEDHSKNTDIEVETVVADKGYGTIANYKHLNENGIDCCIPHQKFGVKADIKFSYDQFYYNEIEDYHICPAGEILRRVSKNPKSGRICYRCKISVCKACKFNSKCVNSNTQGRSVTRSINAVYVKWADECFSKSERQSLMIRRKCKAEGAFAIGANQHGFKKARWRGIEKMKIQNLIIAAIQNLGKLLRYGCKKRVNVTASAAITTNLLPQNSLIFAFLAHVFAKRRNLTNLTDF